MKKIFTLLAFLVVTVNAAAQEDPNNPTCFDVASPVSPGFHLDNNVDFLRGVADDERLNLSGYVFYFKFQSNNTPWNWIYSSNISYNKNLGRNWTTTSCFKGSVDFFGSGNDVYPYCAYKTSSTSVKFIITNCSGIDVFLYHNTTNSGTFSITATPQDESNNVLSMSETLSSQKTYFPSLIGLDKTKSYQVELSIPANTAFFEISFLKRDLRTYQTTVTDGVNWGTMYLDFPVTIPADHPKLEVLAVTSADETNGCSVNRITGSIPKNTGVLLHEPNVDSHVPITFTETGEPDPVFSMLSGTAETDFTVAKALQGKSSTTKVLTLGREKNNPDLVGFFIYNGTTLSQYKAYLTYDYGTPTSGSNVKGFYISGFDELTGVQTLEIESPEPGNWYSLQGVRLNARPTQRGIYLNNGKKVLVK